MDNQSTETPASLRALADELDRENVWCMGDVFTAATFMPIQAGGDESSPAVRVAQTFEPMHEQPADATAEQASPVRPCSNDEVFMLRADEWMIRVGGNVVAATFNSRGAAEAGLEVARRRAEPKIVNCAEGNPVCKNCGRAKVEHANVTRRCFPGSEEYWEPAGQAGKPDMTGVAERMKAGKPTAGAFTVETVKTSCGVCHKIGPLPEMRGKPGYACVYEDGTHFWRLLENGTLDTEPLHIARLFADALNVRAETGKTPRQLAEEWKKANAPNPARKPDL